MELSKETTEGIRELRERRGWTQEKLAAEAGVDVRTVQRIEYGETVRHGTLAKVTSALGRTPEDFTIEDLQDQVARLEEAVAPYRCPYCRSELVQTSQVPLDPEEKVWDTFEAYACGYQALAGETQRLCPRDPEFPPLEVFDLKYSQIDGGWWCEPVPKADDSERGRRLAAKARQLGLRGARGRTQEEARQWLKNQYDQLAGKPWWQR